MAIRYQRMNEHGLAIPTRELDCLGSSCPIAFVLGSCFPDVHHIYFPRAKYMKDELTTTFMKSPFNCVKLPRCQHNSRYWGAQHTRVDDVPMPRRDTMGYFLVEAEDVLNLVQTLNSIRDLTLKLTTDVSRLQSRDRIRDTERLDECFEQRTQFERSIAHHELLTQRQIEESHFLGARMLAKALADVPVEPVADVA